MIAALSLLLLSPTAPPVDSTGVTVRVVRFYRPETGQTQVAAFIESPAVPAGSLTLRVVEADGPTLWEQSWQRPPVMPPEGTVDHLRFTVAPGNYAVEVALSDSTGEVVGTARAPVKGYEGNPGVSDLLLSPLIRGVHPSDTMPRAEEYRRGALMVTAPGVVRIGVGSPILYYYLEAYTPYGGQGMLGAKVRDAVGTVMREAPPAELRIPADLGVLTGQLDLTGMPPGQYSLVTMVMIGERKMERSADFEIAAAPVP